MKITNEKDIASYGYVSYNDDATHFVQLKYIHKYPQIKDGYVVPPQVHSCHEVVYYGESCTGTTMIDGKEYHFNPGDIAFMSKNTVHSESHTRDGALIYFGFDANPSLFLPPNGVYHNMWDLKPIINSILCEAVNQEDNYEYMINLDIQKFLLTLARRTSLTLVAKSAFSLKYIRNYIDENYVQNINFSSLAKNTGYSEGHFRRLFTEAFATSPQNYLISVRCEKAVQLLKDTSMSCTDIASRCGFADSNQLSKMIKKNYGMTPSQIRKEAHT